MWPIICIVLGVILGIIGTIVSFVLIVPDKRRNGLNKFFKFLHDLFNFKFLTLEKIMQAFYIFSTLFVIVYGFFYLFTFVEDFRGNISWTGWVGLLMILFGPIMIRLTYEMLMMFIILVKNTNQINNKLGTSYAEDNKQAATPMAQQTYVAPEAQPYVAPMAQPQAAPVQANGWFCTQCGCQNSDASAFCNNCGKAK